MDISKSFLKKLLTSIVFIDMFGFGQTDVSGVTSLTYLQYRLRAGF